MTVTKIVHVVNRSLEPLEVMDDGIVWTIRPGYAVRPKRGDNNEPIVDAVTGAAEMEVVGNGPNGDVLMEPLPFFAAERAIRQNPVMGTEDPYSPQTFESLVACPAWNQDYSFRQQTDAIERLDRSQLPEALQKVNVVAANGRRPVKRVKDPKTGRFLSIDASARTGIGPIQTDNPAGIDLR